MSAIEEFRALLDERGVEHYDVSNATYWGTDGAGMYAYSIREGADGLLNAHIHDLTPEQVIAAMLGERHAYEQRITGEGSDWGEIMADAFDELMASASESCAPDELARLRWHIVATLGGEGREGLIDSWKLHELARKAHAEMLFESADAMHKAANTIEALSAKLACGECEQVITDCYDGLMPPFVAYCSKCGAEWGYTPRFCPQCGAKVTRSRDERKAVDR